MKGVKKSSEGDTGGAMESGERQQEVDMREGEKD